ncbi:MAG: DUF721 domain-containing protein [Magnetococcales bacterium]|nr:DUF721 domain-containing protein [Magnetococcales bacterium]NGZ29522.1 DUF721 domain-containing protein [Magnetococcales bacterium]
MRKSNGLSEPIGHYLTVVAAPFLSHPRSRGWRLTRVWEQVVGASLAAHTEPVKLQEGVLTIRVDSPVWMHQLSFLQDELLEKLASLWQEDSVLRIELQRAPLQRQVAKKSKESKLKPTTEEIGEARSLAGIIQDEPLRRAVERYLKNQMARNRQQQMVTG